MVIKDLAILKDRHPKDSYPVPALSEELIERGVAIILKVVNNVDLETLFDYIVADPENNEWLHKHFLHHTFGMGIRNALRQNEFTDSMVPTGNLDDYYAELLMEASARHLMADPTRVYDA